MLVDGSKKADKGWVSIFSIVTSKMFKLKIVLQIFGNFYGKDIQLFFWSRRFKDGKHGQWRQTLVEKLKLYIQASSHERVAVLFL